MKNYTLNISRSDICKILTACTEVIIAKDTEMRLDENCPEYRRGHVLPESIKMWRELHDEIMKQLDEQDKKQDWYTK